MEAGTATIKVEADTTAARRELESLEADFAVGRIGRSLGDAGIVASVLGFLGYLIHVVWG